jgi:hypothetical protein
MGCGSTEGWDLMPIWGVGAQRVGTLWGVGAQRVGVVPDLMW